MTLDLIECHLDDEIDLLWFKCVMPRGLNWSWPIEITWIWNSSDEICWISPNFASEINLDSKQAQMLAHPMQKKKQKKLD